jgi:hypothetical protein
MRKGAKTKAETPPNGRAKRPAKAESPATKKVRAEAAPNKNITELESQLARKEEVVVALTDRLEQAAEQLDRVRRTGGNRGTRTSAGIPADVVQEQREVTQELQQALEQWEEMQAGMALGQLQMQVTELRDFISVRFDDAIKAGGFSQPLDPGLIDQTADAVIPQPPETAPSNDPLSGYEAMKADLLGEGIPTPSDSQLNAPELDSLASELGIPTEEVESPTDVPEVDAPVAIEIATADLQELQSAVETRDAYISYLIRKLRAVEKTTRLAGNWTDLENVPDELRNRLEEYGLQLQDARKMAEVENSLERARLAREAARLELLEQQLQKKMKRLGLVGGGPNDDLTANDEPKKKKGGWRKLLGVSNSDS